MNKKLLTVAIASAMATPMAAQAVKYKLSGQVNRVVLYQDDGEKSDVRHVDNQTSGTRLRLRGSEDLGNGMKAGFYWELQTSSAPVSESFPDKNSDGSNNTNNIRQANVWFSGNWGKLTIGQTDGAGNGATESDLSGTAIAAAYSSRTSWTGGVRWRADGVQKNSGLSNGDPIGLTAGQTAPSLDSFSRYDVLRYDSPALGPVTVAANVGNDDTWEVAARLNTGMGMGQLSAALFYGESGQRNVDNIWGGSASFLFSQGTSITFSYADQEMEDNTTSGPVGAEFDKWFVKLGHKWGPHAVSIGYGENTSKYGRNGSNGVQNGEVDDTGFNIGYVYSLKKANTELYAGYGYQEADLDAAAQDRTGATGVQDINVFGVGARVKFD